MTQMLMFLRKYSENDCTMAGADIYIYKYIQPHVMVHMWPGSRNTVGGTHV